MLRENLDVFVERGTCSHLCRLVTIRLEDYNIVEFPIIRLDFEMVFGARAGGDTLGGIDVESEMRLA